MATTSGALRGLMNRKSGEDDRSYLDKSGLSDVVSELLSELVSNRPSDPLTFMSDYFSNIDEKRSSIEQALYYLNLTHHSRPAFFSNLRKAYSILLKTKVTKSLKGLTGETHKQVLESVCSPFPEPIKEKLYNKIVLAPREVVTFKIFSSTVFTVFVLADFLSQSEAVFRSLDSDSCGIIESSLAVTILTQLQQAMTFSHSHSSSQILEAGYNLGPEKLHVAFQQKANDPKRRGMKTSLPDFLAKAADLFLSNVPKV